MPSNNDKGLFGPASIDNKSTRETFAQAGRLFQEPGHLTVDPRRHAKVDQIEQHRRTGIPATGLDAFNLVSAIRAQREKPEIIERRTLSGESRRQNSGA